MNIQLYKLVSGEELIAEKVSDSIDDGVTLKNATTLIYQQTERGVSTGFAPFMPHSEGNVVVRYSSISAVATPNKQLVDQFTRVHSNIVIAPASSLDR